MEFLVKLAALRIVSESLASGHARMWHCVSNPAVRRFLTQSQVSNPGYECSVWMKMSAIAAVPFPPDVPDESQNRKQGKLFLFLSRGECKEIERYLIFTVNPGNIWISRW